MSAAGPARRRIVVTLDSGQVDLASLERLTRLARRIDADLEGVFVEDSDLLRLGEMTFLREFRTTSRRAERFQVTRMQQELRVTARRAERLLSEYVEQRGVRWSFRTWRGSIERELLTGIEADILAVMRLCAVSMQPMPRRTPETVSVYFDGSPDAARGLETAAELAAGDDMRLQVLLAHVPEGERAGLRREAERVLADHAGEVAYRFVEEDTARALLELLRSLGSTALVMQRDNSLLRSASLREYLSRLHCPLLLVR